MQYEELHKGYDYGLSKIYELVINNDPCYAYLMRSNHDVDQKLVMSHVYGHCDFFKNNAYFAHTNRKMMDEMANHGTRIRRYAEKYGEDEVETFVDRCMSIDDLIDIHSTAIRRRDDGIRSDLKPEEEADPIRATRFKSKDYMDEFINPRKVLEAEEEENRKARELAARSFPEHPEKDVLLFLIQYAPLKGWQRDILEIVRNEAYYFTPQGQTKVLNEGWACTDFHCLVGTNQGLLRMGEIVQKRLPVLVSDGKQFRQVYDWAKFPDRETVWVKTRRGLELEGSVTHRLMMPDGSWRRLDEMKLGDHVTVGRGANLWASEFVPVDWQPQKRITLENVAVEAGTSIWTVLRHMKGQRTRSSAKLVPLLTHYDAELKTKSFMQNKRTAIRIPSIINESFGAFLGYLIGDGHISEKKRVIGLTTGDESQADDFARLTEELFGITPRKKWDQTKWRILFSSRQVQDLLVHLGLKTGFCAREKTVPDAILRSPKPVVVAFLAPCMTATAMPGRRASSSRRRA